MSGDMLFAHGGKRRKAAAGVAAAPSRRSQADRRTHDEKIQRLLGERFRDFPSQVVESHKVSGITLRLAIAQILWPDESDKTRHLSPQQVCRLRVTYATGDIAETVLAEYPAEASLSLSSRLVDACALAVSPQCNRRDRRPLIAFLATFKRPSTREIKCILRTVMCVRPAAHQDICAYIVHVMRWIVREGVDKSHNRLVMSVKHVWDDYH